jgi:hypothetical protein
MCCQLCGGRNWKWLSLFMPDLFSDDFNTSHYITWNGMMASERDSVERSFPLSSVVSCCNI